MAVADGQVRRLMEELTRHGSLGLVARVLRAHDDEEALARERHEQLRRARVALQQPHLEGRRPRHRAEHGEVGRGVGPAAGEPATRSSRGAVPWLASAPVHLSGGSRIPLEYLTLSEVS